MGALSPTHWLIIVGVLVLLFGAKRLPDAARSLGRSARILKAEVHDMGENHATSTTPSGDARPSPPTRHPPALPFPAPATVTQPAATPARTSAPTADR